MGSLGRRRRSGGQSLIEFAFFLPWYFLLFVGVVDWGFFAHGLISTESAARVAALHNMTANTPTDQVAAKTYAIYELSTSVNINSGLSGLSLPLIVTASSITGPDGQPAAQVTVEYQTQNLLPIPGLLGSQYTFYRMVEMKL